MILANMYYCVVPQVLQTDHESTFMFIQVKDQINFANVNLKLDCSNYLACSRSMKRVM